MRGSAAVSGPLTNRLKRRSEQRYQPPASLTVEVHIMGSESLNILRARDISPSGIGVHVPHGFSPGDLDSELDLVVTLPGSRSFLARGRVRHQNHIAIPNFFGVEFTDMKPEHRDEIRRFVRRLAEPDTSRSGAGG